MIPSPHAEPKSAVPVSLRAITIHTYIQDTTLKITSRNTRAENPSNHY